MKSKTLLLLSFFSFTTVFAQDSSFQLKNYKYRTPGFRSLILDIGFSGALGNTKNADTITTSGHHFQLTPLNLSYSRTFSTDKRVHTTSLSFSPAGQTTSSRQNHYETSVRNWVYDLSWDRRDRFYRQNQWFFELGNRLSHSFGSYRQEDTSFLYKQHRLAVEDQISLGFGKGRIEMVQDAQMALYILNDLQEQGLISRPVPAGVVEDLAQLVTEINNQRVFDNRKRRMYELTRIENFLREKGLVEATDIRHFVIINDNWTLAYNPFRSSGSSWFVNVAPSAGLQRNRTESNYPGYGTHQQKTRFFQLSPLVGYERFIPVNLKWQRNMRVVLSWLTNWQDDHATYHYNGSDTQNNVTTHQTEASLQAFYGLGYYPNNRTQVNANVNLEVKRRFLEDPLIQRITWLKPSLNFSADYFLSYKTRLSAHWNLLYEKSFTEPVTGKSWNAHNFSTSFSVRLVHAIF